MSKKVKKASKFIACVCIIVFILGMNVCAEEAIESVHTEQLSLTESEGQFEEVDTFDQYVDGIYNIGENARAAMSGVVRLGKSGDKLIANYSTVYTYAVDKIGIKNIKLQYKGSLGIWHNVITLDDRYYTNESTYMGAFSCNGVIGRTYRLKGTHYIIDGSYSEYRDNVTLGLTF